MLLGWAVEFVRLLAVDSVSGSVLTYEVADDCRVGEPECQKRVTRVPIVQIRVATPSTNRRGRYG